MALQGYQKGELARWLQVVADNVEGKKGHTPVPADFVEALTLLRCVEIDAGGHLVLTGKGELALRMEDTGTF